MKRRILAIHQGAELYGSDRSFLSAIDGLSGCYSIDAVLPEDGPLVAELSTFVDSIEYSPFGYLRKARLKNAPISEVFGFIWRFFQLWNKYRSYDVVYVNTVVCVSAILACAFTNRLAKVIHVREIPSSKLQLYIFKIVLRLSRAELVFNSVATKNAFHLSGSVVYNGVAPPKLLQGRISSENIKLLVIGRFNGWKGQDLFLEAVSGVNRGVEVCLLGGVYGDQYFYQENLQRMMQDLNINGSIVSFQDDPGFYFNWADYVVVPSKEPEPFGRVAVEAFSYKKPVVAASHGGLLEIVEPDYSGYLFKPNSISSLRRAIDELPFPGSDKYRDLSTHAFERFTENFSLNSYQSKVKDIIDTSIK